MERERAKMKTQGPPSLQAARANGYRTPLDLPAPSRLDNDSVSGLKPNAAGHDTARPATDDIESLVGDTLNAGGTTSSHASSSSSVFSAAARPSALAAMRSSDNQLTPPTTIGSPSSHLSAAAPAKAHPMTPRRADGTDGSVTIPNGSAHDGPAAFPSVTERVPARDPSRSIQCIKCIYDPLLDTSLSSSEKRKAKPIYKEFGPVCKPDTPIH